MSDSRLKDIAVDGTLLFETKPFRMAGWVPDGDEPAAVGTVMDDHVYIVVGPRDKRLAMQIEATAWAADPYLNFDYMRAAFFNRLISKTLDA